MKRSTYVYILLAVVLVYFWKQSAGNVKDLPLLLTENREALSSSPAMSSELVRRETSGTQFAQAPTPAVPVTPYPIVTQPDSPSAQPPRPPPHALSYVRRGELLVVFGDTLYGKLKEPHGDATGYVKAMPVEMWDGPIPYYISPSLPNPERVFKALKYFAENTPIHFVPFNNQTNAIVFEKGEKDCLSYLGRIGGHQPIYLDDKCQQTEILHELMHVLGFVHEQSRPDRDQYLRVNWAAIEPENKSQFDIAPEEVTRLSVSTPFDYRSIMLYNPSIFALSPTLRTLDSTTSEAIEPSVDALSRGDLNRIYKAYGP